MNQQAEREFYVDTPLGKLHICAKFLTDYADSYPGVYVGLMNGGKDVLLACVEYDSGTEDLLTTVYDRDEEEPVLLHHHAAVVDEEFRIPQNRQ